MSRRSDSVPLPALRALAVLLALSPGLPVLASGGPISGGVVDAGGRPIAGARVELAAPVAPWRQAAAELAGEALPVLAAARSDGEGRFEVAAPAGLWRLTVTAPGHLPESRVVAHDGTALEHGPVTLAADRGLEVRVTAAGRPLAGARVAAVHGGADPRLRRRAAEQRGETGTGGRARLPWPADTPAEIAAVAPGFAPARFVLAAGDAAAGLRLDRGVAWTIEVRDHRRRPVAGAAISVEANGLPLALAGADGRAVLRLPAGDEVALAIAAEGGRARFVATPERRPAADKGEPPPRSAVVTLEPRRTLPGVVLAQPDRRPLAGAVVWHALRPDLAATAGPRGEVALPVEPGDGPWLLSAAAGGHRGGWQWVAREAESVSFVLAPLASLSGRVVDEHGEPVAGASLVATSQAAWTLGRRPGVDRATSGPDGRYRLPRLDPEESHHLRVEHPGYAPADLEVLAPVAGAGRPVVDVVLVRGTRAHGLVLSSDGRPVAGATARLVPVRGDTRWRGPRPPRLPGEDAAEPAGTTDADGRFVVEHLLPGRYDLLVAAAGHAPLRVPGVEVPEPPEDGDLGTVYLEPGAEIAGRVVDANGRPLAGVKVRRYPRDALSGLPPLPGPEEHAALTTGDDGRFAIRDLPAGSSSDLMFDAPGYTQETVSGVAAPTERPLLVELAAAATVAGRVVDGFGEGLAGITVQAMPDEAGPRGRRRFDARVAVDRTDEDGLFEIENVPPGAVRLSASGGGFRPGEATGLELSPGERHDGVRIELERGGTLTGSVLAPDGRPLPDATVRVSPNLVWGGIEGRTDGDGRYRLPGLPEGVLQVRADHPDFVAAVREITAGDGEIQLDLQLGSGHRVGGRVVDDGGSPIAGARVMLGGQANRNLLRPARTRADGRFEIDGVAPGWWRISASKEGWVQAEEAPRIEVDGPVSGVELRLTAGAAVVGHVRGVDLAEIARLRVAAGAEDHAPYGSTRTGTVDYEGGYRIEGLTPGTWRVMAILGEGEGMASGVVELAPGQQEARLDLEVAGDVVVTGRVTLGGRPLSGSEVSLTGRDRVSFARARTGADGRFRIARLERGRYELSVQDYVEGVAERREIDLDGDREVTIEIEAGEVAGRVIDADTGAPLAGVELQLRAAGGSFGDAIASRTRSASPDGGFRLRGVAAGSYRLHARREGYGGAGVEVEVPPGGATEGVEVALPPAAGAVILVRGASGAASGYVKVAALAAAAPDPPPDRLSTPAAGGFFAPGEAGRIHLTALPAGRWRVHLAAPGFAAAAVDLEAPGPPVPVTLSPEAVVDVRVPELAETVDAGRVRLLAADGRPLLVPGHAGSVESGRRLQLGRARLRHVPAGVWTVEVTADDGRVWTRPVTAVAGAAAEAVIE